MRSFLSKWVCFLGASIVTCGTGTSAEVGGENLPEVFRDCENCPQMISVPVNSETNGKPLSFSVYELTWAEYAAAVDAASCPLPIQLVDEVPILITEAVRDDYPMTSIPPEKIDCYLEWLGQQSGQVYRLPTEKEWQEVAELAGNSEGIVGGVNTEPGAFYDIRYSVSRRAIKRVGQSYSPNVGLFDLFENASEVVTSQKQTPALVVTRGGNNFNRSDFDRVFGYVKVPKKYVSVTVGFRIVREGD